MHPPVPPDFSELTRRIWAVVQPYTMTGPERTGALVDAVQHLVRHGIDGAIVECGVWAGGSAMAALMALRDADDTTREVFLYDTFEGMSIPTELDVSYRGERALERFPPEGKAVLSSAWRSPGPEEVRRNLASTGYPMERVRLVAGRVEDTIPQTIPPRIALLRLDTDWYESTRHELEHLYPRLVPGGIMIVDDYGHWRGAREAVDEFLAAQSEPLFLHRIDYTARLIVKPS
jgi:hypothetical protein